MRVIAFGRPEVVVDSTGSISVTSKPASIVPTKADHQGIAIYTGPRAVFTKIAVGF